MMKVNTTHN